MGKAAVSLNLVVLAWYGFPRCRSFLPKRKTVQQPWPLYRISNSLYFNPQQSADVLIYHDCSQIVKPYFVFLPFLIRFIK